MTIPHAMTIYHRPLTEGTTSVLVCRVDGIFLVWVYKGVIVGEEQREVPTRYKFVGQTVPFYSEPTKLAIKNGTL